MEAYKDFVRKNRDFVQSLESLASGITWVLPERFSNSEIGPEAVYAILGIISSVNQHIVDTIPKRSLPWGPSTPSFPWSLCVSCLKDLEAVVEVAAQHFYGEKGKWNFIAVTEAAKVLARLALLRDNGYKMLLQGGEAIDEDKDQNVAEFHHGEVGISGRPAGYSGYGPYGSPGFSEGYWGYDPHSPGGRALSALSRFGENAKMVSDPMWSNRFQNFHQLPVEPVKKHNLSSIWSEKGLAGCLFVTGEILCIMRPLIYVLFIRRFGINSWKPWLLSLVVDITRIGIFTSVTQFGHSGRKELGPLSSSEKDEVRRRKMLLVLYIMRDPFFSHYTRHHLENAEKYLTPIPLVGFLTGKLVELLVGAQTRYTYTSGS